MRPADRKPPLDARPRRARALLERVLRDGGPLSAEYPLVFGPDPVGRLVAIEEQGEVRSACAILVRDLVVDGLQVRAGLVGSVATDPRHRGRGLATRLLREAERELFRDGCVLALLWADGPTFYEKRGWRPVGAEIDFVIDEPLPGPMGPRGVRAAAPDDCGAIHRLYSLHRERVERSPLETAALLRCPDMETLVIQRSKDIAAYACMGRGRDLGRTVHEWAGSPADVLALARAHRARSAGRGEGGPLVLMTPSRARELHALLEARGFEGSLGILGHGRLLDTAGAADLLARVAGPDARFEVDGDRARERVTIHGPAGVRTVGAEELLELLIPARGGSATIEVLERDTGLSLAGLPLPVFVWGLDSV